MLKRLLFKFYTSSKRISKISCNNKSIFGRFGELYKLYIFHLHSIAINNRISDLVMPPN